MSVRERQHEVFLTTSETGLSPPVKYFTDHSKELLLLCYLCTVFFILSRLFIAGWGRAGLLALASDVSLCFVTFPCGILGQVWYLSVSVTDLCRLSYFKSIKQVKCCLIIVRSNKKYYWRLFIITHSRKYGP